LQVLQESTDSLLACCPDFLLIEMQLKVWLAIALGLLDAQQIITSF